MKQILSKLLKKLLKKLRQAIKLSRDYSRQYAYKSSHSNGWRKVLSDIYAQTLSISIIRIDAALLRLLAYVYTFIACTLFFMSLPQLFTSLSLQAVGINHWVATLFTIALAGAVGLIFSLTAISMMIERDVLKWLIWTTLMLFIGMNLTLRV